MTIAMTAKYPGLGQAEINSLEDALSAKLPHDYRNFLMSGNVMIPESNSIRAQGLSGSVSKFLGISADRGDDVRATAATYTGRLPEGVIPVALAGGGNLVCLYLTSGQVFLWDHEAEAGEGEPVTFHNMHLLGKSFSEFLARLVPFDIQSVALKPDDVISVKLKPGFAEKFKDYR